MKRQFVLVILLAVVAIFFADRLTDRPEKEDVTILTRTYKPGHTYVLLKQGPSIFRITSKTHTSVVVESAAGARYIIKIAINAYYRCRAGDAAVLLYRAGFLGIRHQSYLVCTPSPTYWIP